MQAYTHFFLDLVIIIEYSVSAFIAVSPNLFDRPLPIIKMFCFLLGSVH